MDAAFALADNVVKSRYEDIPPEAIEASKRDLLDLIGVSLAATTVGPGCDKLMGLVADEGGKPESTIIGFGGKYPALMAALVNGALGHSLDYDDTHDNAYVHAGIGTIPAALAIAERLGGINGKDFLTAITVGIDIDCRLGLAMQGGPAGNVERGWMAAQVFGFFSAAATVSKLMGLDKEKTINAFGIAYAQASGNMECAWGGDANTRGIYGGFACKGGLLSCLLAQRGVTGAKTNLEGKAGLFNVYYQGGYDRSAIVDDLGKRFEGVNMSFKPWPSCRSSHRFVDSVHRVMIENNLKPDDIEDVTHYVGGYAENLFRPIEVRRKPPTVMDAKYSIPYTSAVIITKGKLGIGDFTDDAIKRPEVLAIAQKVNPRFDPEFAEKKARPTALVELKTKQGQVITKRLEHAYGHPLNPITQEDLIAKFKDCAAYSVKPIPQGNLDELIDMIEHLEEVEDIARLVKLVS
ncbi:MmgE/PrpD family protein [Chloroflexota bacterium]